MFVKIKSSIFIDALQFELTHYRSSSLRGILTDDKGSVCGVMERDIPLDQSRVYWPGLNDLPYGKYTLCLSQGGEEVVMNVVKRV